MSLHTFFVAACGFVCVAAPLSLFGDRTTPVPVTVASTWDDLAFRIEDSRCFVGIAPVYLSVSELKPVDGNLVGTYRIRVPLKSSKNDEGTIVLPLDVTVGELGAKGGVLKGKAISDKDDTTANRIVCEIIPKENQLIRLAITTEHRTISFDSRYEVVDREG
ncbi:MAG: hypothetical protein ACLFVC_03935 [Opitutales bacterium]